MAARLTLQSYLKAPKTASLANGIKNTRTIATFKVPAVNNEPNVCIEYPGVWRTISDESMKPTYSRGTVDREKLAAALKSFRQQAPVDVPVVIAGKTVRVTTTGGIQTNN
jgi:1-pyrroline-5-carboxylate dehydrogenase